MLTKGLTHRHGGIVTQVTHVGHETHGSVADWFFIGNVDWSDGSASKAVHIPPFALCHDGTEEGRELCNDLHGRMSDYLARVGTWHDMKHKRDGRCYSWTPEAKSGSEAV